jgi:hypothetical protein
LGTLLRCPKTQTAEAAANPTMAPIPLRFTELFSPLSWPRPADVAKNAVRY